MKKILVLLTVLLAVVAVFSACIDDECQHYDTTEKVFEPDCTNEGYTERTCKHCGYKSKLWR